MMRESNQNEIVKLKVECDDCSKNLLFYAVSPRSVLFLLNMGVPAFSRWIIFTTIIHSNRINKAPTAMPAMAPSESLLVVFSTIVVFWMISVSTTVFGQLSNSALYGSYDHAG